MGESQRDTLGLHKKKNERGVLMLTASKSVAGMMRVHSDGFYFLIEG